MARMSYGNVRDYVRSRAGAVDTSILNQLMVQALLDRSADLGGQEALVTETLALVADDATYSVPATVDNLLSILDENGCPLPRHQPTCSVLPSCSCSVTQYRSECEMAYTVDAGVITFYPTPTQAHTYTIKAYGVIDTTLFDMDGSTVVWRYVALPENLHQAYANRVLGMSIADVDPGRAQIWLGFSNQSFDAWKRRVGASGEAAGEPVIMGRYGAKKYTADYYETNPFQRVTAP